MKPRTATPKKRKLPREPRLSDMPALLGGPISAAAFLLPKPKPGRKVPLEWRRAVEDVTAFGVVVCGLPKAATRKDVLAVLPLALHRHKALDGCADPSCRCRDLTLVAIVCAESAMAYGRRVDRKALAGYIDAFKEFLQARN